MTFTESIKTCFSKYVDFEGRARRSEYWWFQLFVIIIDIVSRGLLVTVGGSSSAVTLVSILSLVVSLALFLPALGVSVRRLHDTGHSGWWLLLTFTCIGYIVLLVWFCSEGDGESNEYGYPAK